MKIGQDETPKILLEIEAKLKEHCRDYFVAVNYEGKTYWLKNNSVMAIGFCRSIGGQMEHEFRTEDDQNDG